MGRPVEEVLAEDLDKPFVYYELVSVEVEAEVEQMDTNASVEMPETLVYEWPETLLRKIEELGIFNS